ncbi:hypothetical protein NFI96_004700 [Prochilodus magdalenae]|nr:hypothetical protein NFI96_004700 [Prochilodus magdalenae]
MLQNIPRSQHNHTGLQMRWQLPGSAPPRQVSKPSERSGRRDVMLLMCVFVLLVTVTTFRMSLALATVLRPLVVSALILSGFIIIFFMYLKPSTYSPPAQTSNYLINKVETSSLAEAGLSPEKARLNQDQLRRNLEHVDLTPEPAKPNQDRVDFNPEGAKSKPMWEELNPEQTDLKPEQAELNPEGVEINPEGVEINPKQVELNSERVEKNLELTVVLVWLWPFGQLYELNVCSSLFGIEGCLLTADRELFNRSSGVIIHHRDISQDLSNLPRSTRPPHQKWIWMNLESPSHSSRIPGLEKLFNVTLSYRSDADIHVPYGAVIYRQEEDQFTLPNKSQLVCWIVSNWNPKHRRVKYYSELRKHIRVHTLGQAFGHFVSDGDLSSVISTCKFYLAFENSAHRDYITEKLFNALAFGSVPITLGTSRKNYENFIPGDAFIHVDDFPSPKDLADHLQLLHEHDELYLRYFVWRRHFTVKTSQFWAEHTCRTCEYLQKHKDFKTFNHLDTCFAAPVNVRLSERNCIEIVAKLVQERKLDVVHTLDGKEYISPAQISREIRDELYTHGGRINIVELQKIINVDLVHIQNQANDVSKQDRGTRLILGQLIDE